MAASPRPRSTTNKGLAVQVDGAKEMRAVFKAMGEKPLLRQLAKDNKRFAQRIVDGAQAEAGTKRENIVAERGLNAMSSSAGVSVRLSALVDVGDKRGARPVAYGTEFGAHHDRRRLTKNTGGRRTIVRKGENINKVIARVEAQTRAGFDTVPKRAREKWGATPVKVTGVVKGWNTFPRWRGNKGRAGYFLYPTIRRHRDELAVAYADNINKIWNGLI